MTAHAPTAALALLVFGFSSAAGATPARPKVGKLTRARAVELGATRNLALLAHRAERARQALLPDARRMDYIPMLTVSADLADDAPGTTTPGDRQRRLTYGTGVHWTSTIGTQLAAALDIDQRLGPQGGASGTASGDQHSGALQASLTQPLLKGAWRAGASTPLLEAELDQRIQQTIFIDQLAALLVDVEGAYWQLALAQADVAIKTRSRDRARGQYDDTKENIRRGIVPEVEIYVVEENQVFFEQELLKASENLTLARRRLARLLDVAPDSPLEATDRLERLDARLPRRDAITRAALRRNPGLVADRLRLQRSQVQLAFARNQALPSLDLGASLKLNGLDDSYRDAWSAIGEARRVDAQVGLSFSIPLSWRANRASKARARLAVRRELLRLQDREATVRFEVADLLTRLEAQVKRLELAQRRVRLGELKLDAELEKYKRGISTLADVVRFQRELDGSRISLRRDQANTWSLRSRLLRSQGRLHEALGISLGRGTERRS